MRVLILGGAGMLGHKLYQTLRSRAETFATVRKNARSYERLSLFSDGSLIDGIDVLNTDHLHKAFAVARPDVVINCVGVIKQLKEAHDPVPSISINSLLPHRLAALSAACGARFFHISTDCVFSGEGGPYSESSTPDATDLYGRSKLLGETDAEQSPNAVTLRTSIIGREIETSSGLIEWFLSQRGGNVKGFKHALFTGFTTQQLAKVIADLLSDHRELSGLWQVSSDPISKYDLLGLVNAAYQLGIRIEADTEFRCDRRLDSTRFRAKTGFQPLPWPDMIEEMRCDPTPYEQWRAS